MAIDKINSGNSVYTNNQANSRPAKEEKNPQVKADISKPAAPVKKTENLREAEDYIEDSKKVKNAIAEVNRKMNHQTRCEFSYHEETKRVSIKVINSDTNEIIREIPPEETLDMLTKMWEVAGILVDETR